MRNVDRISGMCADGKHGRCTGWMVIPNYNKKYDMEDLSVKCRCFECKHPDVDPARHLHRQKRAD